jgi:hypothetical protein
MTSDLQTLRVFNEKVARLERTRFANKYRDTTPEVVAEMRSVRDTTREGAHIEIVGEVAARLAEHDQDDIDAFVLTFRMFMQKNDRVSLRSLANIYAKPWMPTEAAESFQHAREVANGYLDSPILLEIHEGQISRRMLVDVIVYGGLAHTDSKKGEVFRDWIESPVAGFFWVEFVVTMKDMLGYLAFFRDLNEAVIANRAV